MGLISSRSNPRIKSVRALRQHKARQESGLFLVEGIRHVGEAVEAGAPIEAIYYAPDLLESQFAQQIVEKQEQSGVPCYPLTAEVLRSLADKENPQGLLAVVRQQRKGLDDLSPRNFPWGVALIGTQDPGNLGAILRSIDAVGANGMLILDGNVDPYHPNAVRASMGALFWHPVVSATFDDFARWVKRHGYHLYGSSAHGDSDYRDIGSYQPPAILLLGSERQGLTTEQAALCERVIRLPMRGRVSSLNLAVAAGVLLYAMLERQAER